MEEKRNDASPTGKTFPGGLALAILLIVLGWAALFATRLLAPSEFMDNDQQRPAAYALDVIVNGQWIVQRDNTGDITSKPPFYTWILSLTAMAFGELNEFTLYLPGAVFVLIVALMLLGIGRIFFHPPVGFLAAAMYLFSYPGYKQVALARTDALFALLVFVTAMLAWHAWRRRGDWTLVWIAAALATLTKGPLVLLLVLGGMLAMFVSGRDVLKEVEQPKSLLRRHLPGVIIYLVLCVGWFAASYVVAGKDLTDKMVGQELVGHATKEIEAESFGERYLQPVLYFFQRFAPWSLLALIAMVRLVISPSRVTSVRLLERFLAAYFLFGLLVFCLAPHQRFDHQFPLIPAAALLAARELARWLSPGAVRRLPLFYAAAVVVGLLVVSIALRLDQTQANFRSKLCEQIATELNDAVGREFPIMHLTNTMGVQFYMGVLRPQVTHAQAIEALLSDRAAYLLVRQEDDFTNLERWKDTEKKNLIRVWEEPDEVNPFLRLVSNRQDLEFQEHLVFFQNDFKVESDFLKPTGMTLDTFHFHVLTGDYFVRVTNRSDVPRTVKVVIHGDESEIEREVRLIPRESFSMGIEK